MYALVVNSQLVRNVNSMDDILTTIILRRSPLAGETKKQLEYFQKASETSDGSNIDTNI